MLDNKLNAQSIAPCNFSVVHINIKCVPKDIDNFSKYIDSLVCKFIFIGMSETWFNDSSVCIFVIEGYQKESVYHYACRGGGVSPLSV